MSRSWVWVLALYCTSVEVAAQEAELASLTGVVRGSSALSFMILMQPAPELSTPIIVLTIS